MGYQNWWKNKNYIYKKTYDMKKQLLSLCIAIGTMAFAQSTEGPKFGIKAGGNFSSITGDDTKSKFGFYAGALVNVPISEAFSIQPEVVYSQQVANR
ncbi:hypothetical protein SRABI04_01320 [Chryseobacterium sp. Bi04]|nr:hypothetical protein SRABI04_01320 [Chryseobacterium sp. Bi04]